MIFTLTLNPALDLTLCVDRISLSDRAFVRAEAETAGGKGINAARLLETYGVEAMAAAPLGGPHGWRISELLLEEGVPTTVVPIGGTTRRNIAITDPHGRIVKVDGRGPRLTSHELQQVAEVVDHHLPEAKWLMLNGSVPNGVDPGFYGRLIEMANEEGVQTLVDTSGPALEASLKARPSVVKPNQAEAEELLGRPLSGVEDAAGAATRIRELGAEAVVLSLGAKGAIGAWGERRVLARVRTVRTGNAVGAGDVLGAVLVWSLVLGEPFDEALRWGVAAATAAVARHGPEFGSLEETESCLAEVETVEC